MTTDEILTEIVSYQYKSVGLPFVFLDYNQMDGYWSVTWRNPIGFSNEKQTAALTPNEACRKALEFIKSNPQIFSK
jgi:hypothetical protein